MDTIIFTPQEVLEFSRRYQGLPMMMKEILNYGSFCGKIDDFSLALGYGAPASTAFRNAVNKLKEMGAISVYEYTEKMYKDLKTSGFHFRGTKISTGKILCFCVPEETVWIRCIRFADEKFFPPKNHIGIERAGNDLRYKSCKGKSSQSEEQHIHHPSKYYFTE